MTQLERFTALLDEMNVLYEVNRSTVRIPVGYAVDFEFDVNGKLISIDVEE